MTNAETRHSIIIIIIINENPPVVVQLPPQSTTHKTLGVMIYTKGVSRKHALPQFFLVSNHSVFTQDRSVQKFEPP